VRSERWFGGTWWQLAHLPFWGQSWNCAQSCDRCLSATHRGAMRCLCHRWCAHRGLSRGSWPTDWHCVSRPWAELCQWDRIICVSAGISNTHNAVEQANIEAQFAARASFPNVIGAIDCTHSVIKAPSHEEFVYVTRKHFHSMYRSCDAQMQLTNIVARWPGSTHNSWVTALLGTDYKLALCEMGGFLVRNFIRVIVLILFSPNFYPVFTAALLVVLKVRVLLFFAG